MRNKKIKKEVEKCFRPPPRGEKGYIYGGGLEVGRQFAMAGGCETRVGWVKVGKPVGWEKDVDGERCWCGEDWDDNHEDGNHEDVWMEEAVVGSVLGKRAAEAEAGAKKVKKAKMTKKEKTAKAKAAKTARAARAAKSGGCGV